MVGDKERKRNYIVKKHFHFIYFTSLHFIGFYSSCWRRRVQDLSFNSSWDIKKKTKKGIKNGKVGIGMSEWIPKHHIPLQI